MARKPISASLRWNIFYRDGFACRYCGAQAGEEGVELAIDHVLSVADGGDNRIGNLVTACKRCNGGKGAKSIVDVPSSKEVADRVERRRRNIENLRDEIRAQVEATNEIAQEIINLKCTAYGVDSVTIDAPEISVCRRLLEEFGAALLLEWYTSAFIRGVSQYYAIKYVCGCARRTRERQSAKGGAGADV